VSLIEIALAISRNQNGAFSLFKVVYIRRFLVLCRRFGSCDGGTELFLPRQKI